MQTVVTAVGILVSLALLWTGHRKLRLSSFPSSLLYVLDVLVLVASVVLLGWLGLALFVGANAVAILAWSIYLAAQKEEILLYASTQCGVTKEEMYQLFSRLRETQGPFRIMSPIEQARLMSALAQRARSPEEIEQMATPIAMLWVVHRPDLTRLVSQFDRLLRLYNMDASESMRAADLVSATTKTSAATFEEVVEGLMAAAS